MSPRRAAPGPRLWPVAALAIPLLGASFACLQLWLEQGRLADVPVYQGYAELMRGGAVPYRDFPVEYPPAALPAFLLPAYLPWSYGASFAVAMGVCGAAAIAAAAAILRRLDASPERAAAALGLMAVSPLVLGSLFDTRFDLWPAFLAVAAVAALVAERPLLGGALGGIAFAAKLWPGALAPLGLAFVWRRHGPRAALGAAAAFTVLAAACIAPFAVLAPGGVWHSVAGQLDRPLQVESLGAALLLAVEQLGGPAPATVTTHGSQALSGTAVGPVGTLFGVAQVVAVAAVWLAFARRRHPGPESLLLACAAALAALLAFGRVLSPQYLIWLVPFVPLVPGRRGAAGSLLLLVALGLTSAWFPDRYWQLALGHASPWTWLLLARDLVVVALAALLAWPARLRHEALDAHHARLEALEAIRARID